MPDLAIETHMDLMDMVMETLKGSPRALVVKQLREIADELDALKAGDHWLELELWDLPTGGQ